MGEREDYADHGPPPRWLPSLRALAIVTVWVAAIVGGGYLLMILRELIWLVPF